MILWSILTRFPVLPTRRSTTTNLLRSLDAIISQNNRSKESRSIRSNPHITSSEEGSSFRIEILMPSSLPAKHTSKIIVYAEIQPSRHFTYTRAEGLPQKRCISATCSHSFSASTCKKHSECHSSFKSPMMRSTSTRKVEILRSSHIWLLRTSRISLRLGSIQRIPLFASIRSIWDSFTLTYAGSKDISILQRLRLSSDLSSVIAVVRQRILPSKPHLVFLLVSLISLETRIFLASFHAESIRILTSV